MATTMKYGDYEFSPVPFLTINKDYQLTGDGSKLNALFSVTIDGTLTPLPGGGGIQAVDDLQDSLKTAFNQDGLRFLVQCDGQTLIDAYPRILSINFAPSNNNWTVTSPFTIQIEFDSDDNNEDSTLTPYVSEASETWNLEFSDDRNHFSWSIPSGTGMVDANPYVLRLSHSVSAKGKRHFSGTGVTGALDMEGWKQARSWVVPRLGFESGQLEGSGVINLTASAFSAYNHSRTQETNETDGGFSVSETWLVMNTGLAGVPGNALEDFNVNIRTSIEDGITTIGVEGSVQGVETRSYGSNPGDFSITQDKYNAAENYWGIVKDRLYYRAKRFEDGLNSIVKSSSVSHNPPQGSINYTYEFDNRPCNFITGALSESITITDNSPLDVFASLTVLGRANGPILQDIGTVTAATREISVEVVMPPLTGCSNIVTAYGQSPRTQVAALICDIEEDLTNSYSQVFKTNDSESWNIKNSRYTRNVSYLYSDCSGTVNTSLCG